MNEQDRNKLKRIVDISVRFLNYTVVLLLGFILLRIFVFGSYRIPTASMEPTIIPGDYVFVNKLAYGARLFNLFDALEGKRVNIWRVPGYTCVKNNDVVVFHIPHPHTWGKIEMDMSKYFIKRCIGVPGDTLKIVNGFYEINSDTVGNFGCIENEMVLSEKTRAQLPDEIFYTFPMDSLLNWNIKQFGPLYIPKKGDEVVLDRVNSILYKKIIEWEKGHTLMLKNGILWDNNRRLSSYVFLHNYFFMGGDKVEDSQDSRYWGLLPDDLIVGKVSFIWKSRNPRSHQIRWHRIFKTIEN